MNFQNKLFSVLTDPNLHFISCDELESEIQKVLNEEKILKYVDTKMKKEFWYYYFESVEYHKIKSSVKLSRDKKDNYLLSLAKDSKVDFLITGDKDLLVLKKFENTSIITLSEFLPYLNKK
ncbi:MAG: putative toxin-antitoxin system toxin component, PIN family [Bacteroidota bacterium]|nr:putative toxin-antitoxin system toxin component, PIN family [Bacteroidota bacterium]